MSELPIPFRIQTKIGESRSVAFLILHFRKRQVCFDGCGITDAVYVSFWLDILPWALTVIEAFSFWIFRSTDSKSLNLFLRRSDVEPR